MTYKTSPCRSCQAPMIWTTSPAGKALPLDARPSSKIDFGDKAPPTLYKIAPTSAGLMAVVVGYIGDTSHVSHFATCPNAREHTKRAKR